MNTNLINTPTTEPSLAEQMVQSTIAGLEWLAEYYGYEFDEAIYHIESLHRLAQPRLTREQEIELENERVEALSDQAEEQYLMEVSN